MVNDYGMVRDMTEGTLKPTSNPFDVAISGPGYFIVNTSAGERYTRNGHFSLDANGRLVTSDGDAVLDSNHSEITFAEDETNLSIARDGSISTSAGSKGKIGVVQFADEGTLTRDWRQPLSIHRDADRCHEPQHSAGHDRGIQRRSDRRDDDDDRPHARLQRIHAADEVG